MLWTTKTKGEIPKQNGCSVPDAALVLIKKIYGSNATKDSPMSKVSFEIACNAHDNCYSHCGGTKVMRDPATKTDCDTRLLEGMQTACARAKMLGDISEDEDKICNKAANDYWTAVLFLGESAYNNRQNKNCACHCP